MHQIALDFEINKPAKNEIERNVKKKINKKEMEELNKPKLWKEPSFLDWYNDCYSMNK